MMRNVYLKGELAERFGERFKMDTSTGADVFRCIYANRPEFKSYLVDCVDKGIDLNVKYLEKDLDEEGMLQTLKEGDIVVSIVPAGSKSGISKILAAVALTMLVLPAMGAGAPGLGADAGFKELLKAGLEATGGKMVGMMAVNLAMTGISQVLAPDPSTDSDSPDNYLFNGSESPSTKTDPVPILYGELRVPGRLIDFDIINGTFVNPTTIIEYDGSLSIVEPNKKSVG
jgi:predicted phage tail protein